MSLLLYVLLLLSVQGLSAQHVGQLMMALDMDQSGGLDYSEFLESFDALADEEGRSIGEASEWMSMLLFRQPCVSTTKQPPPGERSSWAGARDTGAGGDSDNGNGKI